MEPDVCLSLSHRGAALALRGDAALSAAMNAPPRLLPALSLALAVFSAGSLHGVEAPAKPGTGAPSGLAALLSATGLTQAQLLSGLKSGLGTVVEMASAEVAKPGSVQLGVPSSMSKLEGMLKAANQTGVLDGFKASLSSSAGTVAPQATSALKDVIGSLSLTDAAALTSGTPDAATKLLRKVAEPALRTKLMPLVSQAIAANGTAAKAKSLAAQAGPMAAMMGVPGAADLEGYVFAQVLDKTFAYVAKGEAAIRANPALLKDKLAAAVFKSAAK